MNPILAHSDSSLNFQYVEVIGNWGLVEEMNAQRRQESENIANEVDLRVSRITQELLRNEIGWTFLHNTLNRNTQNISLINSFTILCVSKMRCFIQLTQTSC